MSDVAITLARPTDCVELGELSRIAIEYGLRWRWKPSRVLALIRNPDSTVIVGRNEAQELMGFAAMEFAQTYAHLVLMATAGRFRRQSVATRMLTWLESSASIAGLDHISLEVRRENSAAVKFYETAGYRIEKVYTGYYDGREDAYRMRHDLIGREFAEKRP